MSLQQTIYDYLNMSLKKAQKMQLHKHLNISLPNCMFYCNDTQQANDLICQWAANNDINLYTITNDSKKIDQTSVCLIPKVFESKLTPSEKQLKEFNKNNTVIFLKDLDEMKDLGYRRRLFDLINDRQVTMAGSGEQNINLDNLLFVVATCTKNKLRSNNDFIMRTTDAKDTFRIINIDE